MSEEKDKKDKKDEKDKGKDKGKDDPSLEQNKTEPPVSLMGKVVVTGFVGGVFWSFLAYLAYIFNFTEVSPNMVLQPIAVGDWKNSTLGTIIGIAVIGVLSIGAALVYYAVLKRFNSMWVGMIYGVALWGLVFFLLNPIFPNLKTVFELQRNTIVTTVCFYILYGIFVGYSISFEYNELNVKTEANNEGI